MTARSGPVPPPGAAPAPVACTLDAAAWADRVGEWRDLVASSVRRVESGPSSVRLVLRDTDDALLAAASLGAREKACCAFFDVAIDIEPHARALRLSVPDGAEEALAAFAELLRA